MAINWRFKNKKNVPFFGLGIFSFALLLSVLFLDYRVYKDNFETASLLDMTNGKYREDANYVDTCVGMFHDLVADMFYRDGCFLDTENNKDNNSLAVYNRVAKLRSSRGLYTYVNQGHDSYVKLFVRSYGTDNPAGKYMTASLTPKNIQMDFYNNGNAYSGREITSYHVNERNNYDSSIKLCKFGITFYESGQSDFMVIGSHISSLPGVDMGRYPVKFGVIRSSGDLYQYTYRGSEDGIASKDTYEFVELNKYGVKGGKGKKPDIASNYLYTVSDESGKYTAEIDASLNSEITTGKFVEQEEEGNTLTFKEVWNSVFALAKFVPEKTPLLFYSYDTNIGSILRGNEAYVKRYRELYEKETVEVFNNEFEREVSSKRYKNNKDVYSIYPHGSRSVNSIFTIDKKIVALFADQNFQLQYKESPLYSYELAAVVLRYSIMIVPVLFLLSLCFLMVGIYRKQQKNEQSVRVLAMGFFPVEIRGVILLALCCSLTYCYTMVHERNFCSYISPFLILMFLIFVGSTICWWRMDRQKVFVNSWIIRLADHISEKNRAYYQAHGMSFFLRKRSNQFACSEIILGVLVLLTNVFQYILGEPKSISSSLWGIIIVFLIVIMIVIFISYLRFLSIFVEGLNGVQHQLDLMGEGDFETIVPLPKNFYGFQVEEQFESIKNGMLNAMEGEMRSERMKIDLVANVSHDIKTPLTSIINYVDLLADSKELPLVEADYVQVLQKKSYRLRSMIQDLFDLSKATSGNLSVEFAELNFTKLIQQTMADMQESIEASDLQFKCNLLEQVHIMSDGNRLYRVLQNLINNAINYSMERSRVYLNLDVVDDLAIFSIKNMSRDELNFTREQVMERFFRGDQSRSTEGSGLGVAIANSFVEVCGGEFDITIDADLFCATIKIPVVMPLKKIPDMQENDM